MTKNERKTNPSESSAPDLNGLRHIYEVEVYFDDERRHTLRRSDYWYKPRSLTAVDFPISNSSEGFIRYTLTPRGYWPLGAKTRQVLEETGRRNLVRPDRAVVETVLLERKDLFRGGHLVGICGREYPDEPTASASLGVIFGCMAVQAAVLYMDRYTMEYRWPPSAMFIMVIPED